MNSADDGAETIKIVRDFFDVNFYLSNNLDVASLRIDPIAHFVSIGWKQGRDPNPHFSVSYYLATNKDVRDLKINPFVHYITTGRREGRLPKSIGGYKANAIMGMLPLEDTILASKSLLDNKNLMSSDELSKQIRLANRGFSANSCLIISIGHDNYRRIVGGVQACIQQEEQTAKKRGLLYVNLYPAQTLPRLAHVDKNPDVAVCVIVGGELIGTILMQELIHATSSLSQEFKEIKVIIHHLLGHNPEQITDLVRATGSESCWFWLHDYFSLCPSYTLQRNKVSYCGAPPKKSNACGICLFGEERINHRRRIDTFFESLSVNVIAPSQFAAGFWSARSEVSPASLIVCDHMTIEWEEGGDSTNEPQDKITIGFVGEAVPHKGWPLFWRAVKALGDIDSKFDFVYFGTSSTQGLDIEAIPIKVTAEDRDAMIHAIKGRGVDLVLHWANWPETFSFTTFEAIAAGAYVLTNPISGNVAATVKSLRCGAVLNSEQDLREFFQDGRVEAMVAEARARRKRQKTVITRSDMTFSCLEREE